MKRFSWSLVIAAAVLGTSTLQAQSGKYARFEIVPLAGYVWGGSYNMDFGDLHVDDSFGYGIMLNFLAARGTALELTYLRQDTATAVRSYRARRNRQPFRRLRHELYPSGRAPGVRTQPEDPALH